MHNIVPKNTNRARLDLLVAVALTRKLVLPCSFDHPSAIDWDAVLAAVRALSVSGGGMGGPGFDLNPCARMDPVC